MNQITRCPNCATAFRVTDEQLAAFMGKVRCGRCSLVFNALDALIPQIPPAAATESDTDLTTTPESAPAPDAVVATPTTPEPAPAEAQSPPETSISTATEAPQALETPSVADLYAQALEEAVREDVAQDTVEATEETIDDEAPDALMHPSEDATPEAVVETLGGGYRPITLPEDEALFAPIQKPRHARIWTFFALLIALVLILQILFAYRVRIAMEFPALQPRLATLCDSLGCDMPLPKQGDLLRLEWSELTYVPDHPTLIQLSATLRNLAPFEQALPLLELTLTDTRERVVARRVFRPGEYLAATEKTRRSLTSHDELHAFLQLETGELKSTGYSLYWFYE